MSDDGEQRPDDQPGQPPPYPTPGTPGEHGAYQQPQPPYPSAPAPPGWGPQPGYRAYPSYVRPDHPKATTALVLGIVSVAGLFTCVLPVLVAPVAWVIGANARREIRNSPQQWGGDGKATAGMVLGIIGTVLLVLLILAFAILIAIGVSNPDAFDSGTRV